MLKKKNLTLNKRIIQNESQLSLQVVGVWFENWPYPNILKVQTNNKKKAQKLPFHN